MRTQLNVWTALLIVVLAGSFAEAQAQSPLQGVWRKVEVTTTSGSQTVTQTHVLANLYIFTEQYFSVMYISGVEPRPLRGPRARGELSDAEKIAEYDPFLAYSGLYNIEGSRLTIRPIVALNPSFMAGGFRTDEFELDGDILWLIMRSTAGPATEIRTKLVRVEGGSSGGTRFRVSHQAARR